MAITPALLLCVLWRLQDTAWPLMGLAYLQCVAPEERARAERYDRHLRSFARRSDAKQEVARELASGRLTLLEAAARARDIDRAAPDFPWAGFRLADPAGPDDERHCREVIGLIRATLPHTDPATEAAARRCEADLRSHVARGTLRLPEPAGPTGTPDR